MHHVEEILTIHLLITLDIWINDFDNDILDNKLIWMHDATGMVNWLNVWSNWQWFIDWSIGWIWFVQNASMLIGWKRSYMYIFVDESRMMVQSDLQIVPRLNCATYQLELCHKWHNLKVWYSMCGDWRRTWSLLCINHLWTSKLIWSAILPWSQTYSALDHMILYFEIFDVRAELSHSATPICWWYLSTSVCSLQQYYPSCPCRWHTIDLSTWVFLVRK